MSKRPNTQAAAPAEANQGDKPEAPATEVKAESTAWKIGDVVEIVSVHGRLLHLHTNQWFGVEPETAEIDAFLAAQLAAGKLAIAPSAT